MEHAKKMYLVDERTLKSSNSWLADKVDENAWGKPVEKRAKNELYRDMTSVLEDEDLAPDQKAKLYNQQLIRFQNTNPGQPMMPYVIKPDPVDEPEPVPPKQPKVKAPKLNIRSKRKQAKRVKVKQPQTFYWSETEDRERSPSPRPSSGRSRPPIRRSTRPPKPIDWDALYE